MSYFATTFAFCFDLKEGMLLLSGLQMFSALFWVASLSFSADDAESGLQLVTIALMVINSFVGMLAVRSESETMAAALCVTFGAQVFAICVAFGASPPPGCDQGTIASSSPLARLLAHLLWTADACLLMSILGWIALGACFVVVLYLWYMCACFWHLLRRSGVASRRVVQAIRALPMKQYHRDAADEDSELDSCAICLSDFEEGELVRELPCGHQFRKPCIDLWIRRQGMSASCPLCKRALIPREVEDAPEGAGSDDRTAAASAADGLQPLQVQVRRDSSLPPVSEEAEQAQASPPAEEVPSAHEEADDPASRHT